MNQRQPFHSLLIGLACLSFLTGVTVAQQPFDTVPVPDTQVPSDPAVLSQDPSLLPTRPFGQEPRPQDQPFGQDDPLMIRPDQDRTPMRPFVTPPDQDESQDQTVLVNTKYAGWQEASGSATGERLGDSIRGHWVMVDANGQFQGSVMPGKGADVTNMNVFLMNMGRMVKQTTLDVNGRFEFKNVRQGAYALIGWGEKGLFAFGMNVLAHNPDAEGTVPNRVSATAFQNATTINTDWIRYYAPNVQFRVYGRYPEGEGRDDPKELYGFEGLVMNHPPTIPANSISSHPVSRTADGRLVGRVHQFNSISGRPVDVRSTRVMLLEDDSVVAATTTDNYGIFEFQQVPDGSYGLAAAGVDGLGLISINVEGDQPAMNDQGEIPHDNHNVIDFTMISSETIGWLNDYANEVAYRRSLLAPRPQPVNPNNYAGYGCPNCGNQAGGCGACQAAYMNSLCRSRGLSFEQWQMYCQGSGNDNQLGNGLLISEFTKAFRRGTAKLDNAFERGFYPSEFENEGFGGNQGGYQNYGNQQGYPNQGQGQGYQPGYPTGGYQGGYQPGYQGGY